MEFTIYCGGDQGVKLSNSSNFQGAVTRAFIVTRMVTSFLIFDFCLLLGVDRIFILMLGST